MKKKILLFGFDDSRHDFLENIYYKNDIQIEILVSSFKSSKKNLRKFTNVEFIDNDSLREGSYFYEKKILNNFNYKSFPKDTFYKFSTILEAKNKFLYSRIEKKKFSMFI